MNGLMGDLLVGGVLGSQLVVIGVIAWNEASHAKTWRAQAKLNLEIDHSLVEIEERVDNLIVSGERTHGSNSNTSEI